MKKILLSLKPNWYDEIMSGKKIFEYRNRFCEDEVIAYLYVSRPAMEIKGVLELGSRRSLSESIDLYGHDIDLIEIMKNQQVKHKYAIPIKSYQQTTVISLEELRYEFNGFMPPQMYYNLDGTKLLEFIDGNLTLVGEKKYNSFCENLLIK